ncbi:glycosyltransferase family 4 protein [Leeuwenhoekiella polynyae]|uniref:Glycosyl transferase family 1 n=1 Tax=Leeuwenhoekiella polynyae TaxID=1550906 RepID=A0A4Q0PG65_9FLAO|nr:glycosyltransferase family 4 protein [Leeuwenhoekiella polynyae]RXG25608.1 glycosyl transferase family 1 [Leeuwenhoekiella polynyae]
MKIIISHPTANANVREAIAGFLKKNLVYRFYTTIAVFPNTILDKVSEIKVFRELKRRSFHPALESLTRMYPFLEAGRQLALKGKLKNLTVHEKGMFSVDSVYRDLDQKVSRIIEKDNAQLLGVYCYEDGALLSFTEAKKKGISCFYDLPIGYWRAAHKILKEEQIKNPEWGSTLLNFNDSEAKLQRKDHELDLATKIFVASTFTAKTLRMYPGKLCTIHTIPYGFPPIAEHRPIKSKHSPLKLLFVGGLSQRKGLSYLFEAVSNLGGLVELTLVGAKVTDNCKALNAALLNHNWIPSLPHDSILKLMREQDVLVFPSLFEGFGLVITEAMSQGTPVITTDRTAGPDLIEDGVNGWLIEAASAQAIKTCIMHLVENRDEVERVGAAALETARKRPWSVYGEALSQTLLSSDQNPSI